MVESIFHPCGCRPPIRAELHPGVEMNPGGGPRVSKTTSTFARSAAALKSRLNYKVKPTSSTRRSCFFHLCRLVGREAPRRRRRRRVCTHRWSSRAPPSPVHTGRYQAKRIVRGHTLQCTELRRRRHIFFQFSGSFHLTFR